MYGRIEYCGNGIVRGWAIDASSPELSLEIVVTENGTEVDRLIADVHRGDLLDEHRGSGRYGFIFQIPKRFENGLVHHLHFCIADGGVELENSPVRLQYLPEADLAVFKATSLTGNTVLVLSPHPDDETFGAGGSIVLHRKFGDKVKVAFLTDGDAGVVGKSPSESASIRQAEARAALQSLGVSGCDLIFFDIPDRCLSIENTVVSRLVELLLQFRPTLIYAPSPMEFHPDHKAACEHLFSALKSSSWDCMVALYEINRPFNPNCLVDITDVLKEKEEAAGKYASQQVLYPYWESISGLNKFRALTLSPDCEAAEAFVVLSSAQVMQMPTDGFFRQQMLSVSAREEEPLVSVVIRTRNRIKTLQDAILSVIGQNYPNLELVVVNDGGQDVSDIVERFSRFLTVKYVCSNEHVGRSAAGNLGFEQCSGRYICLLDDDDLWQPNHVKKLADFLTYTGSEFAYSDCERITYSFDAGEMRQVKRESPFFGLEFDRTRLYADNFISPISAMFTRSLLDKSGGFDPDLDHFEDWDLWIRMSWHSSFHRLPGVTCTYRVFEEHKVDAIAATLKVMSKHAGFWSSDAYQKYAWHVVSVLRDENEKLRQRLTGGDIGEFESKLDGRPAIGQYRLLEAESEALKDRVRQLETALHNIQSSGWVALGQLLKRYVPASIRTCIARALRKLTTSD